MKRQTFFQGTLILLIAGLITRVLGFIPKTILPRIIGTEGIGLYQMAFSILIFYLTIARFGLNVSISKIVAEAEAEEDFEKIKRTLITSVIIVLGISLVLIPVAFFSSFFLAKTFFTDERVLYPLLASVPMIPIIALSTILKGYFQGRQNMIPTAVSNVIEALVRIIGVIIMTTILLPYGIGIAAAGAMIGVGIGELVCLGSLFLSFRRVRKQVLKPLDTPNVTPYLVHAKNTFQQIWNLSLPVTALGLVGSISFALEPIIVVQSLAVAGISASVATALYGELGGLAIFLIVFPTTLTYSLSVSLVPAVSEAFAKKNEALIRQRLNQSLRLALIAGSPFAVIFYIFAEPICAVLFNAPQVGDLLKIIAPFSLFLYFQSPLAATLQGMGMARVAFYNSLFGAIIKTGMIFVLGSQPELGIYGVALAMNIGMTLITMLHFLSISKKLPLRLKYLDYFKTICAALLMGYCSYLLYVKLLETVSDTISLLVTLTCSVFVYMFLLSIFKAIRREEVARFPIIGEWLSPFFPKR